MKTCTASHHDLYRILAGLRKAGVTINDCDNMEITIHSDWHRNLGEIIFHAKPAGRKGDEIWYSIEYSNAFDMLMGVCNDNERLN